MHLQYKADLFCFAEPLVINFFKRIPMESCFRRPKCHITNNKMMHDYWVFVSHMIPAYISDLGLMLMGKKPTMVRIYNKLHKAMTTLNFFTHNEWTWTHKNMDVLKSAMSPEDQKVKTRKCIFTGSADFRFYSATINTPTYRSLCVKGYSKIKVRGG